MKRTLYLFFIIALFSGVEALSQGCVAVRHMSTTPNIGASSNIGGGKWQVSMGYRYFRSHRHFVGREYQEHRRKQGSEVINVASSVEITPTYSFNKRFSASFTIPLIYNDRSSLYEHDRVNRYHTYSKGLGDIRVMANYWLYDPETNMDNNISVGVGLKLPTGNSNVKDEFHRTDGVVKQSVDQSIQLGDGGLGYVIELQGFRKLFNNAYGYIGGFYLLNPKNTNDTERGTSGVKLSVADQYMVRGGLNYNFSHNLGLIGSFGGRAECIPSRDLLGSTGGFRRPGYIVSLEPGATFARNKNVFNVSVPVAVIRNRTKSLSDLKSGRHGDAAFADFVVYMTYTRRF